MSKLQLISPETLEGAVSDLLNSHRVGNHFFVISKECSQWLANNLGLIQKDKGLLAKLGNDYVQTAGLARAAIFKIRITHSDVEEVRTAYGVEIGISHIRGSWILNKPALVVENAVRDGDLYELLIGYSRVHLNYDCVSFDIHHGGGSGVKEIVRKLVAGKRLVVTVIDSDKYTPYCTHGKKYFDIISIIQEWKYLNVVCFKVRELENLLTMRAIKSLPCAHGKAAIVDVLEAIAEQEQNNGGVEFLFFEYFDIKNGLDGERIRRLQSKDGIMWILEKMKYAGVKNIDGFGDGVVDQILMNGGHILRSVVRSSEWWTRYGEDMAKLIWWGMASRRLNAY